MTKPTPAGRYLVAAGQSGEADLYKADFGLIWRRELRKWKPLPQPFRCWRYGAMEEAVQRREA